MVSRMRGWSGAQSSIAERRVASGVREPTGRDGNGVAVVEGAE